MIENEIYLYLRSEKDRSGTFKNYKVYYELKLAEDYATKELHAVHGEIEQDPSSRNKFIWKNLDGAIPTGGQEHKAQLRCVKSKTEMDKIPTQGEILIDGILSQPRWAKIKLTLQLTDANGGPIMGNGSTSHYGDADE